MDTNKDNLLTQLVWHISGLFFIFFVGSSIWWETPQFWNPATGTGPYFTDGWVFLSILAVSYACSWWGSEKILSLPHYGRLVGVLFATCICFAASSLFIFLGARSYYSRPFLLWAFGSSIVWLYLGHRFFFSFDHTVYGFVPGSVIQELASEWRSNFVKITHVDSQVLYDILVIAPELHDPSPEWMRYAANRTIQGIPMVHPAVVYEFFTGRLPIEYMTDGPGFVFRLPRLYPSLKPFVDAVLLVLVFAPTLMLIAFLVPLVYFCSGSPVFFIQERLGYKGRSFRMYKFRSMTETGEITRIGKFLRKYRLDELPQILNVLKGDMSFIGPRPEVVNLAHQYKQEITFYGYRTSMRPGITGWAQVNYGYASVTSENRIKLGYDLYYIKNASLTLDALVLLKTIKTMLTGFGAR